MKFIKYNWDDWESQNIVEIFVIVNSYLTKLYDPI